MAESKDIIIRPNHGFQEYFASASVDVVFGGGAASGGKSYGLVLALAESLMTDADFRCMISRRSLGNQKAGGGFVEKFKQIFGMDYIKIRESDSPRITFPNGSFCDLTYIDDSNIDKLRERAKGWEYDVIAIDEMTEVSWEGFTYIMTRNRGQSKTFTGKIFATFNPKRSHWTRTFLDWYIGADGYVRPERDGRVRYFYVAGLSVKDVVWGDTKEEVYKKCKIDIDRKLKALGGSFTYSNMIKSFVFYQGKVSGNTKVNSDYVGSIAASGGMMSQALLEGNFNVDPDEEQNAPIKSVMAREVFMNDARVNGDLWVTVDLADYGSDNMLALAWNGFHIFKIMIVSHTKPRENAQRVMAFAQEAGVAPAHIIYDATAGRYFNDYIPEAIPYLSSCRPYGTYGYTAASLKDLCYLRLVRMINRNGISMEDSVAESTYTHQNLKYRVTVQNEFLEECAVVRFSTLTNGRQRLFSKKQMNMALGKGRSMDLLDPCAMRMLPCAELEYGRELEDGFARSADTERNTSPIGMGKSIYDETLWY